MMMQILQVYRPSPSFLLPQLLLIFQQLPLQWACWYLGQMDYRFCMNETVNN